MKSLIIMLILLALSSICFAEPDWEVVIYTNSTVAYCQVTIDEIPAQEGDLVGAFIEDECRGIGEVITADDAAYATLNIQGNAVEMVSFLVWDESIDTICAVEYTTLTNPGYDIGYPPDFLPIEAYSGNPINHYPQMELPVSLVIPEDIPTSFDFAEYCWDPDNDPLSITGQSSAHINLEADGLIVTLTSSTDWVGFEYITIWLSDGSLAIHDSVEIFVTAVNDPPQITDTYPPQGYVEIEQNSPAFFSVNAFDVDSALEFEWFIDDQVQNSTEYIFNHTFATTGNFVVECHVFDQQYVVEALWQVNVTVESGENSNLGSQFTISPNPCSGSITINCPCLRQQTAVASLYDLKGRKIAEFPNISHSSTWNIPDLPAGIYFIKIYSGTQAYTKKITVK